MDPTPTGGSTYWQPVTARSRLDGEALVLTPPEVLLKPEADVQLTPEKLRQWQGESIAHYLSRNTHRAPNAPPPATAAAYVTSSGSCHASSSRSLWHAQGTEEASPCSSTCSNAAASAGMTRHAVTPAQPPREDRWHWLAASGTVGERVPPSASRRILRRPQSPARQPSRTGNNVHSRNPRSSRPTRTAHDLFRVPPLLRHLRK